MELESGTNGLICENPCTDITPTCVIKDRVLDGAVLKVSVGRPDVLKVTVLKQGIFKLHRLDLYIHEPR